MPETRILIVDDEPTLTEVWLEFLQMSGAEDQVASTGAEAREALDRGFVPDVVLLDWTLPDVRGEEILGLLEARVPETRVVVVTGHGTEVDDQVAGRAHAVLHKPFPLRELLGVLPAE